MIDIQGITYKIGTHGLVFKLIDGNWIKSTMTAAQIKSATAARRRKSLEELFYGRG